MIFGGLKIGSTSYHNEVHNLDLDFKEEQKFKEHVSITEKEDQVRTLAERGDMFSQPIFAHENKLILLGKKAMYIKDKSTEKFIYLQDQGEIQCEDIARR